MTEEEEEEEEEQQEHENKRIRPRERALGQKTRVMKIFINFYTRIVKYIFTRQFFFEMPTRLTILTEPRKALQPKSTQ